LEISIPLTPTGRRPAQRMADRRPAQPGNVDGALAAGQLVILVNLWEGLTDEVPRRK